MNQRTKKLLIDMSIALIIAIVLGLIMNFVVESLSIYLAIIMVPIVWISLRYGVPTGVVVGALTGLIIGLIDYGLNDLVSVFGEVFGLLLVGFSGMFAKYTQKTLNNKRLSSTYLNIVTASLLATFLYYIVKFWLTSLLTNKVTLLSINNLQFWYSLLLTWIIISLLIIIMSKFKPQWIIPSRSKFLSRKETTSLLND